MRVERKHWLIGTGALLLLIVLAIGGTMHHRALSHRQVAIEKLERELAGRGAVEVSLAALQSERDEKQQRLVSLHRTVPATLDAGSLLQRLSGHLTRQNMRNREVASGTIASGTRFRSMPVTLQFQGSFDATWRLIESMESEDALMRAELVDIRRHHGRPSDPLTVTMRLTTYAQAGGQR